MSNTLGPRVKVAYTSDTGEVYNLLTDADLATAAGLPAAVSGTGSAKPTGFTPRGVYVQAVVAGRTVRKRLTCNADFAGYATDNSTNVTIAGTVFQTTGRQGESYSF